MTTLLGLYDTNSKIVNLQRFLNEKLKLNLTPDGNIGKVTQSAILTFQKSVGVFENDDNGPCYGPELEKIVLPFTDNKYLNKAAFVDAAKELGIEPAVLQAVTKVEAKQFGFLNSGHPVILFERHKFYYYLSKKFGVIKANKTYASNPDICNAASGGYLGNQAEVERLERAKTIDQESAFLSVSWGLFQIMGFNYAQAGYKTVDAYVNAMLLSEKNQLLSFVNYIKNDKDKSLLRNLVNKNWAGFANEYNGPAYQKNKYDLKLASEYTIALNQA